MLETNFPSSGTGPITVVQGSLLEYEDAGKKVQFLYVHDHKIMFRKLRKELGIPRRSDVIANLVIYGTFPRFARISNCKKNVLILMQFDIS